MQKIMLALAGRARVKSRIRVESPEKRRVLSDFRA
jgi:hypothetical protein